MADTSIELSTVQAIVEIIKTIGVAATALFWILLRTDRRLDRLTERMDHLVEKISERGKL